MTNMKKHNFIFNPQNNGGEQVLLISHIYNGTLECQELSLNSYGQSASIFINGHLSPQKLRQLADELEKELT